MEKCEHVGGCGNEGRYILAGIGGRRCGIHALGYWSVRELDVPALLVAIQQMRGYADRDLTPPLAFVKKVLEYVTL